MNAIAEAVRFEGVEVDCCALVPTPALALHGFTRSRPSIMVTGSHIPADRNGIKFNMPEGEVLKKDERGISDIYETLRDERNEHFRALFDARGYRQSRDESVPEYGFIDSRDYSPSQRTVMCAYRDRYLNFFGKGSLKGTKTVVYEHSSVSRDILPQILQELGADVFCEARSSDFIAVDTEAIEKTAEMRQWIKKHNADVLVSTDGDGDRPLVVDEQGVVVRGDILGILTALYLKADSVTTPVSSSSAVERCGKFSRVRRTRIGSPFVIAGMQQEESDGSRRVVGYEANGGFLTQTDIVNPINGAKLSPLPTRDAVLPIVTVMQLAGDYGNRLSQAIATLPSRHTVSGIIRDFPPELGAEVVNRFLNEGIPLAQRYFTESFGNVERVDFTDGVRMFFEHDKIVHLRPSGNAPEFRCYTEAASVDESEKLNRDALNILKANIRPDFEK